MLAIRWALRNVRSNANSIFNELNACRICRATSDDVVVRPQAHIHQVENQDLDDVPQISFRSQRRILLLSNTISSYSGWGSLQAAINAITQPNTVHPRSRFRAKMRAVS